MSCQLKRSKFIWLCLTLSARPISHYRGCAIQRCSKERGRGNTQDAYLLELITTDALLHSTRFQAELKSVSLIICLFSLPTTSAMLPSCLLRNMNSAARPQLLRLQRPLHSLSLLPCSRLPSVVRHNSTRVPQNSGPSIATSDAQAPRSGADERRLSLTFTCTAGTCSTRSTHQFTKRAYEKGVVLIECPGCKTR